MSRPLLTLVSLLWGLLVVLVPSTASWIVGAWITALLIAINFCASTWTLFKEKRIPLLLNLVQIGLFGVLHFQLFSACGSEHYHFEHWPRAWDWLEFTAAHVIRAVDFLDFLESYGIELQNLKHGSTLSGVLLVWMHVTIGIFLVSVVGRWAWRFWRRFRQQTQTAEPRPSRGKVPRPPWAQKLTTYQRRALFCCFLAILGTAIFEGWAAADWFLWPLDQVTRTVDLGGAMHIFGWKLHDVASGAWLATLGLVFRVVLGSYLARWLKTAHTYLLGPRALKTMEEFVQDLEDPDASIREGAVLALATLGPAGKPAVPPLVATLGDESWRVVDAGRAALARIGAPASESVPELVAKLSDDDWAIRRKAVELLGEIGPPAGDAVPFLVDLLADRDPHIQSLAAKALPRISPCWCEGNAVPKAIPGLIDKLAASDCNLRRTAADVLGQLGEAAQSAVPALLRKLQDRNEYVRISAAIALDRIDPFWRQQLFVLQPMERD